LYQKETIESEYRGKKRGRERGTERKKSEKEKSLSSIGEKRVFKIDLFFFI
jgi:hypothetical protein